MNHLAHFRVAHPDPSLITGSFLGDFVKGRLHGQFPAAVERGIRLHRAVDAFTDHHPVPKRSVDRFDRRFRRYGPIMVDVIYDHFLACSWTDFGPHTIGVFCDQIFAALGEQDVLLPEAARSFARRMAESRSLERYHHEAFIDRSLIAISHRLTRANPLADGFTEFGDHREALHDDFRDFFPELHAHCVHWLKANPLPSEEKRPRRRGQEKEETR